MKLIISFFFLLSLISNAFGITCPKGFTTMNGQKCVRMIRNNLKHLEAETDCSYFGGTLVTIKSAIDNRAVANLAASSAAQNVWIGMFCFANVNTTSCYHDDSSGPITFKSFAAGNPQIQGNGGCVYMSTSGQTSGMWYSAPCEAIGMPFVCEVPPTVADPTCVRNYNGYCYMPSHEIQSGVSNTTYSNATAICQANGGNLVSLHSKPEIDYVRAIYKDTGLQQIFIGASAFLPDTFDWADGSNWDYDYTNPLAYTTGDCLQMDVSNKANSGLWSETSCQNSNYFLCKKKLPGSVDVSTPGPVTVPPVNAVNPKFGAVHKAQPHRQELLDFSNCNSTLIMSPGVITSFGYPNENPPITYCSWRVVALGPYRVSLYFTDFSVYNPVNIYDEYGNLIKGRGFNQGSFSVLGPSNIVTVTHDSSYDSAYNYHGFSATILPY